MSNKHFFFNHSLLKQYSTSIGLLLTFREHAKERFSCKKSF